MLTSMPHYNSAHHPCTSEVADWLDESIRCFIQDLCNLHRSRRPSSSSSSTSSSQRRSHENSNDQNPNSRQLTSTATLLLTNFTPVSVSQEAAPIPHKWHRDQIIKTVVDDFGYDPTDDASVTAYSTDPLSRSHTAPHIGFCHIPSLSMSARATPCHSLSSPRIDTLLKNDCQNLASSLPFSSDGIAQCPIDEMGQCPLRQSNPPSKSQHHVEARDLSHSLKWAQTQISEANSSSSGSKASPNTSISWSFSLVPQGTKHNPIDTQQSKSSSHRQLSNQQISKLERRKDCEAFGLTFLNSAFERLQLSSGLSLQIERIQELATGGSPCSNVQRLEKEKASVKNELKNYDLQYNIKFGLLPTREAKEPLRPLYMYYRRLKIAIQRGVKKQQLGSPRTGAYSNTVEKESNLDEEKLIKLQQSKMEIRNRLQQFQENFVKTEGRPIRFHRDIVSIENEYKQYKQIKEHIKKLDEAIKTKNAFKRLSISHVVPFK